MKKFWKLHRNYILDEVRSIATTALSFLVIDGAAELLNIYNGDWSKTSLFAFLLILARSLVKAVLKEMFPKLFPARVSVKEAQP